MKSQGIGLVGIALIASLSVSLPAFAGNKSRYRNQNSEQISAPAQQQQMDEVTRFLVQELGIEDPAKFNLTIAFKNKVEAMPAESRQRITELFSQQSAPALGEMFRAFGRTAYNNVIALGPAGVGKSFMLNQITMLFSMGIYPDYLKPELGIGQNGDGSRFEILREALLGKTDVIMVDSELLSTDNTQKGKAFATPEMRMHKLLIDLFEASKEKFQSSGRRTIFVFDEVATLPETVQKTLKKILDQGGLRNPNDPLRGPADPGYSVLAMTTPDEYRAMVAGDSAVERRYAKIRLKEPTEEEAFRIVRTQADIEWAPLYGQNLSDDAIWFLIQMRRYLSYPPRAMPAAILEAANDLILSPNAGSGGLIGLRDAKEFLMRKVGLTDIWFEGPNGEPPFHDFEARVNRLVVGQEEVVGKVAERLKSWARLGFGGEVPIFFLGGSSGSGKDTLIKAINEVLFGHDGRHLMFSIGGAEGFAINSIIEGPPRGNHADKDPPLLVQALDNGPWTGVLVFNEGKDAPTDQLEKFKVFIEAGEVRPKGQDVRVRPLLFPVFVMGQWGEELFDGKRDEQIDATYRALSQAEMERMFLEGKDGRRFGAVSRALLDRAKKTGGVFMLRPVPRVQYPKIVELAVGKIQKAIKRNNNITFTVSEALMKFVAESSIRAGEGTRGLGATTIDYTETAISNAMDQGLRLRDAEVTIDYEKADKDYIVVKSGDRTWKFEADSLRRIKTVCESELLGLDVKR